MDWTQLILSLSFLAALTLAQIQTQNDLNNMAEGLQITWTVTTNTRQIERFEAEVTLKNEAKGVSLGYGPWKIFFNYIFMIEPDIFGTKSNVETDLPGQGVRLTHYQGSLFSFEPTTDFVTLPPGSMRKIKFKVLYWSVARTDSMHNWYMTAPNMVPVTINSTMGEDLAFVADRDSVKQWKRFDYDYYNPYTAQERYDRNFIGLSPDEPKLRVIPKTVNLTLPNGNDARMIQVDRDWYVSYVGAAISNEATYLAEKLKVGKSKIIPNNRPGQKVIYLEMDFIDLSSYDRVIKDSADAYTINVDADSERITIRGMNSSGVFYGVVTLLNMMDDEGYVPECSVVDSPRFEYRGLMLDIARSFHPRQEIIDLIELMATYKLNKLHLHMTDDEGWRLQIPALPELTELGSQRCHDLSESECLQPELGSGPDNSTSFGSGFLTSNDYVAIIRYARDRHVTVIPEIDMPGHARAAIKSMELRFDRLSQLSQADLGKNTTLTEINDTSVYTSPQMFSDNAVNPCLESTYNFVAIVMDEIIKRHAEAQQPLKVFHFGGDEVGKGAWVNSTICQNLKEQGKLPGDSPKWYFFQRVARLAEERGLSLGAWEDGLIQQGNAPFDLETIPIPVVYAYTWDNVWEWGTLPRTYGMANEGYKIVMTHGSHFYFDHPYEPDPEERGYYWATRFTDTKKTFSYNAENYYDNIHVQRSGQPITDDELCGRDNMNCPMLTSKQNLVGMEATLFSETSRTREIVHERLFPRLLAFAERAWHEAPWEDLCKGEERDAEVNSDWQSFARAVGHRELKKLDSQGVAYRIPPPGGKILHGRLVTTPLYPGLQVQYSFDAGLTWRDAEPTVPIEEYQYRIWLRTRTADGQRNSRTIILHPTPRTQIVNQPIIDYIADNLKVQYTVVDNYKTYGDAYYWARIQLTNMGNDTIPGGHWRIYFTSVNIVEPDFLLQGREYVDHATQMTIGHTKGYLHSLGPGPDFGGLKGGDELEINFRVRYWSVSRYEQMPRWYVCAPGMNPRNIASTVGEDLAFVSPFTKTEQWKRTANDKFDPWTPGARYDRNKAHESNPLTIYPVIPTPVSYQTNSKEMVNLLEGNWTVVYKEMAVMGVAKHFVDTMNIFFPNVQVLLEAVAPSKHYISFGLGEVSSNTNSTEAYSIRVNAENNTIAVTSVSPDGAFNGAMTLLHLALKSSKQGMIPDCDIVDWPRFHYRGMFVDSARNFLPKPTVLKLLDVMAVYKLNKFHFHLCDDEGWRLEIPGLEELTKVGGRRCHDLDENECIMSTLGSGGDSSNSGSGFYTVDEYKEILRYAADRHIEVIPEFDMPGHSHAAIRAMRARKTRLDDLGENEMADKFLLDEQHDMSHYYSVQFYTDNGINPCIESTYSFIQELFNQITEMHKDIQPLKVYHFGGDEVAKGAWVNSSACIGLLQSGANLKEEFTRRVAAITRNVSLMAWEDGLVDHDAIPWERSLLPNQDVIAYAWQNVWEWGTGSRAYNLANAGFKVVFSPVTHTYFDHPQEPSPEERGFYWGTRYTDTYKTFSFMPDDYYMNADIKRSGEPITMEEICTEDNSGCPPLKKPENIIGMQGQLWSETVRLPEQFEYMVFPRLLALAERAWHKGSWEGKDTKARTPELKADWTRFAQNLGSKDLAILDKLGVAYRVPPPGARQSGSKIDTKVEFPGLKVQFKYGDSDWKILPPSLTFKEGVEVHLRSMSPNMNRSSSEVKVKIAKIPTDPNDGCRHTSVSIFCLIFVVLSQLVHFYSY